MHPILLLLLAIFTPFLLSAVLFLPPYTGLAAADYLIYNSGPHPYSLADKLFDVFYMIDVYSKLLSYWSWHIGSVSLLSYSLPLIAMPLAGLILALWLLRKLTRKLMDVFHLSVSH